MCVWSDIPAVQDCEMHYMNAWLKRCVFNLDKCRAVELWKNNSLFIILDLDANWIVMIYKNTEII